MLEIKTIRTLIDQHFSLQWCRDNVVVPVSVEPNIFPKKQKITIAVGNFTYLGTIGDFIKRKLGEKSYEIVFVEKAPDEINKLLDAASQERKFESKNIEDFDFSDDAILSTLLSDGDNQSNAQEFNFVFDDSEEEVEEEQLDLSIEMIGSEIQRAAAQILLNAVKTDVSDIHIEPGEKETKIRFRRDGVLQNFVSMPKRAGQKLTACIKNMANMDIAERRASQDGKIRRKYEGKPMEFRCSSAPGKNGEKLVLRFLNNNNDILNLDTLITDELVRNQFRDIMRQANGIIIVSGPTGSGKSTTLASALREKDTGEQNIVTAEDPIEYDLGGDIQQFNVLRAKGQTFANLLRTFLRQDPDVILIGETRDPETAESSMDAAETGHLVFTTLHANSASSSLTRLLDMEVPSYKLTTSLRGILAQRLMRKVCPGCSVVRPLTNEEAELTNLNRGTPIRHASVLTADEKKSRKIEGTLCKRCNGIGYKGRVGTYELLIINGKIRNAIKQQLATHEIEEIAQNEGMLTLKQYASKLIQEQLTTISELKKISNKDT